MRLPRDISGAELIQILGRFGYHNIRQTGSHVRLMRIYGEQQEHHITIPLHKNLRLGTLNSILQDVSARSGVDKEDIFNAR